MASGPIAALNAARCRIHVVDVEGELGLHLPARYVPKQWKHNQYAVEHWLRRALESHPWRTYDADSADVIFAAANLSMWCVAGKTYSRRRLWESVFHPKHGARRIVQLDRARARGTPVFVSLQFEGTCGQAHLGRALPKGLLLLREEIRPQDGTQRQIVSPFVVSRPPWLIKATDAAGQSMAITPWAERKLLFFAGRAHICARTVDTGEHDPASACAIGTPGRCSS